MRLRLQNSKIICFCYLHPNQFGCNLNFHLDYTHSNDCIVRMNYRSKKDAVYDKAIFFKINIQSHRKQSLQLVNGDTTKIYNEKDLSCDNTIHRWHLIWYIIAQLDCVCYPIAHKTDIERYKSWTQCEKGNRIKKVKMRLGNRKCLEVCTHCTQCTHPQAYLAHLHFI